MSPHSPGDGSEGREASPSLWRDADAAFERLLDLPRAEWEARIAGEPEAIQPLLRRMAAAHEASGMLDHDIVALDVPAPGTVGEWQVGGEIGRGGMSVVYRAERDLGGATQVAALKLLTLGTLAADGRNRFNREHRMLARMEHPHIVPLLDAGVLEDGTPYLAMPLVDGMPIDAWCRSQGLSQREVVRLFLQVCSAVAHAHRQLVVHRDLKPSNILVDGNGEVRLLDFGIARLLEDMVGEETATRERMMTPQYAAPELLSGRETGTAVDVFGLGAVLYQLLVGKPPRRSAADAGNDIPLASHAAGPPANRALRGDLDAILACALERDSTDRYGSVEVLRDDLQRWLDGMPVQARRAGRIYRVRKFVARHRGSVAIAALLVVAVLAGLAGTTWQAWRAERAAAQARQETARADNVRDFMLSLFEAANPEREGGAVTDVRRILAQATEQLDAPGMDPVLRADLEREIGMIHFKTGDIEQGRKLVRQSLAHWQGMDEAALEVARTHVRLAALEYRAGRYQQAKAEAEAALGLIDVDPPPDIRLLISALQRAGTAEAAAAPERQHPVAIARIERALALVLELEPPDPSETYAALKVLGQTHRDSGDYRKALPYLERALAIGEQPGTTPRGNLIPLYWELGVVLNQLQQGDRALEYADRALALTNEVYPPGHPKRAHALLRHGRLLAGLGDKARAAGELSQAVEIFRQQQEGRSPGRLASALFNLATLQHELGDWRSAVDNLAEAQQLDESELGPLHGYVLSGLSWRARILDDVDDPGAGPLFAEVERRLALVPDDEPWSIHIETAAVRMAEHRIKQGRHAEALRWVEQAIDQDHARNEGVTPTLAWAELVRAISLSPIAPPGETRAALERTLEAANACSDEAIINLSRDYLETVKIAARHGWPELAREAWETYERRRGDREVPALWQELHQDAARIVGTRKG